jgi:hypothetical protein
VAIKFIAWSVSALTGGRYRAYRQLAARYKGRCESRGLVDPPTVSFTHGDATVRVGLAPVIAGQANPARTRIVVRFKEGSPFRFELIPALRPAPPQTARGTRAFRLGEPAFDRDFVVRANDAEICQAFLSSPEVRQGLDALRRFAPPAGMLMTTNPERLLIQVDRDLGANVQALDVAVRWGLYLHDRLAEAVASQAGLGVSIVETAEGDPEELGAPVCKVCGEAIEGEHVRCSECRTPHHGDCWEFVGGCSIYGCKGRQARPQPVRGGPG